MPERLGEGFADAKRWAEMWLDAHAWVVWGLGILSVTTLVLSLVLIPRLIARMPEDYYTRPQISLGQSGAARPIWMHWLIVVGKNACGLLLLAAGLAMLVLPGQGLLTILAALALLDFPYKRQLEMRLMSTPGLVTVVTWLRRRAGKPPLRLDI